MDKNEFLYPYYYNKSKTSPNNKILSIKLQDFSQKVNYTVALENNGKISPREAYKKIEYFWEELKYSKKQLKIINKKRNIHKKEENTK